MGIYEHGPHSNSQYKKIFGIVKCPKQFFNCSQVNNLNFIAVKLNSSTDYLKKIA